MSLVFGLGHCPCPCPCPCGWDWTSSKGNKSPTFKRIDIFWYRLAASHPANVLRKGESLSSASSRREQHFFILHPPPPLHPTPLVNLVNTAPIPANRNEQHSFIIMSLARVLNSIVPPTWFSPPVKAACLHVTILQRRITCTFHRSQKGVKPVAPTLLSFLNHKLSPSDSRSSNLLSPRSLKEKFPPPFFSLFPSLTPHPPPQLYPEWTKSWYFHPSLFPFFWMSHRVKKVGLPLLPLPPGLLDVQVLFLYFERILYVFHRG